MSEAEVDSRLARQGLSPEQRRKIIALLRQDVCGLPDLVPVCRYYGAETIHKIQKYGWGEGRERGEAGVAAEMRLLEYGASQNLLRLYEKGTTDAFEDQLDNSRAKKGNLFSIRTEINVWFACSHDEQTLPISAAGLPWRKYRLTTCGTGLGVIVWVVIFGQQFGAEADLLFTHSRFARKVGLWWLTGAEPSICADSIINGSGNPACNSYAWQSGISWKFGANFSPPASVVSKGSASRLNQGFALTIVHQ
jgi:hypothetical protein